ncbi:tetratricopeptide repeat protein (macronuclear) [Tetrahymena thermophila SB210]|uniref:Tetratricopeptide repeat protein n=1 Tax=Tetrahymena thermophila (strain SB210) TaxID=312017 RepID=Q248I9_TETTS|nr:tetratricopeptide repeat protein [Tetrahymena thermophila SB210]EAS04196.3 tetratricopeptide repeat protein [Tetrahymena thermophila SB210]|eukprot:XP_001024441.3 tetratricopeptide repeat protein [Tetrahymena thermophila SB210]
MLLSNNNNILISTKLDKCDDTLKSDIQFTKNYSQSPKIPISFDITYLNIQQKQLKQVQSISFGQNHLNKENLQIITSTAKLTTEESTTSFQSDEFIKLKQDNKNQILKGLKPLFLEMKIIKQTFQDLENLINYSIDAQNYNSEDFTKSLFHFSKAKSTFQQLKNQIGLWRCYYNLGLASLLNKNYYLAQEYFESAIELSLETIGIDYQGIENYKIFNKSQNNYENQLQILTKKIFSKAYCLKQQALSFYYLDQNETNESSSLLNRNFFKHNHDIQRIQQRSSSNETLQLLNQSLNTFKIVLKFVENNQLSFSDICKIHLYQEIIEIFIFLRQNNNKIFYKLIEKVNQIMNNQKYQDNIMSEPSYISSVNTYKQILEIQKSRQLFLLGLIEQSKNNNIEAFELFTQSIEEGSHYSPQLRKKLIIHMKQAINDIPFKSLVFETQKQFFYNKKTPIDLTIVAQLDYCKENYTIESILQNIQKTNLFEEQDRIQILIYHSEIDIFISYTVIQCSQDWNVIIDSLKDIERTIINDKMKTQLSWQEALFQSLQFINDFRRLDHLVSLKQQYFDSKVIQNNINERSNQKFLTNEIKKVILLLSNNQENDHAKLSQRLNNFQKIINNQKPIVYHLKESTSQNNKKEFNSPFISYEPLENENQIVSKLIQLRKEDHLNEGQEFLSILYNF